MKIVVTGAEAAIGEAFVEKYSEIHTVIPVYASEFDLTDIRTVSQIFFEQRPDVVLHLDEMRDDARTAGSYDKQVEIYNVTTFKNIQTLCILMHIKKLIVIGSGTEYGASQNFDNLTEEDLPEIPPDDSYGLSKYVITNLARKDTVTTVLRCMDVYGPYCDLDGPTMEVFARAAAGRPLDYEKNAILSPLYVEDAAAVAEAFITGDYEKGEYNIANPETLSRLDLIKTIKKATNKLILCDLTEEAEYEKRRTFDVTRMLETLPGYMFTSYRASSVKTCKWCAEIMEQGSVSRPKYARYRSGKQSPEFLKNGELI